MADKSREWRPLFNGKDLSGWYTYLQEEGKDKDGKRVFQVHDGMIHLYKDGEDGAKMPFGYIATNESFADYRIRLEYRWGQKRFGSRATRPRDSGLLYHVYGADGARAGIWPYSIECQIQENDVGDVFAVGTSVGTTIDPAKPDAPTFKDTTEGGIPYRTAEGPKVNGRVIRNPMAEVDGWNKVEVEVRGDGAVHIVNGRINNRITAATGPNLEKNGDGPWVPLRKGRILLQAEGAEVFFRNIEIQEIAPSAK